MITNKPKLSIALPTHGMEDRDYFFRRCLDSLWRQTFQDFEIVVTDNSDDDIIKEICEYYKTGIRYYRNPDQGMAPNTNAAIKWSKGEIVKVLYMDDYLAHEDVLEMIVNKFKGGWLISGSDNNSNPKWTEDIHLGNNKLGSPSALAFENKDPILFEESLTWLLDCDVYKRLYDRYGEPTIMHGKHIGIGEGLHQATYLISDERKGLEHKYLINKYG